MPGIIGTTWCRVSTGSVANFKMTGGRRSSPPYQPASETTWLDTTGHFASCKIFLCLLAINYQYSMQYCSYPVPGTRKSNMCSIMSPKCSMMWFTLDKFWKWDWGLSLTHPWLNNSSRLHDSHITVTPIPSMEVLRFQNLGCTPPPFPLRYTFFYQ